MEILKYIIHILGFVIIYYTIDYKRKKPITSLLTLRGWGVMIIIIFAVSLIGYKG
jgi:hypothetical protein